jgi:hypothetical protein
MSSIREFYLAKKPIILAFVIGLLMGPFISGMMGWQIRSSVVTKLVHTTAVQQQAKFCAVRARATVADVSKLDYSARFKLAEEWAKMPWQQEADSEVVSACSDNLSESA